MMLKYGYLPGSVGVGGAGAGLSNSGSGGYTRHCDRSLCGSSGSSIGLPFGWFLMNSGISAIMSVREDLNGDKWYFETKKQAGFCLKYARFLSYSWCFLIERCLSEILDIIYLKSLTCKQSPNKGMACFLPQHSSKILIMATLTKLF